MYTVRTLSYKIKIAANTNFIWTDKASIICAPILISSAKCTKHVITLNELMFSLPHTTD